MTYAKLPTAEQVRIVVEAAKQRPDLWDTLKSRELELEEYGLKNPNADPPDVMTQPALPTIIDELFHEIHADGPWITGGAIMAVRRELRKELGLRI